MSKRNMDEAAVAEDLGDQIDASDELCLAVPDGHWAVPLRTLSLFGPWHEICEGEAQAEVDVLDFNNDQDPTVVVSFGFRGADDDRGSMFLPAFEAERLGVYLLQAAAMSRQVEPGGPESLVVGTVALREPVPS